MFILGRRARAGRELGGSRKTIVFCHLPFYRKISGYKIQFGGSNELNFCVKSYVKVSYLYALYLRINNRDRLAIKILFAQENTDFFCG